MSKLASKFSGFDRFALRLGSRNRISRAFRLTANLGVFVDGRASSLKPTHVAVERQTKGDLRDRADHLQADEGLDIADPARRSIEVLEE